MTAPLQSDILEIAIDLPQAGVYPVRIKIAAGAQGRSTLSLPPADSMLEALLAPLTAPASAQLLTREAGIALGTYLYRQLFVGETQDLYQRAADDARRQGRSLQIYLELVADDQHLPIAALPWELLTDELGSPLVSRHLLIRTLSQKTAPPPLHVSEPLRMLIASALPPELASTQPLNLEAEIAAIEDALQPLSNQGRLSITISSHTTGSTLQRAIREQRPHLIHLIAHGAAHSGRPVLVLEADDRSPAHLTADQLTGMVANTDVRLIVLNACDSGHTAATLFQSFGPALLRAQVPAVIGMQSAIDNTSALIFVTEVYRTLAQTGRIAYAVQAGRTALLAAQSDTAAWAIATLYLRASDDQLFQDSRPASTEKPPSPEPITTIMNQQGQVVGTQYNAAGDIHLYAIPPLHAAGLQPHALPTNHQTIETLQPSIKQTGEILRSYPDTIAGQCIAREEVQDLVQWTQTTDASERFGVVLDQPGGGKTVVFKHVLEALDALSMTVLVIKADLLSGISSVDDLVRHLGLPGTIEDIARLHAEEASPFIVLIDQVDALSYTLARDQRTLDVVLQLISRLRDMKNVRILTSCRIFDLNTDPKLSNLKDRAKQFQLLPLAREHIEPVLHTLGIDPAHLLPAHWDLLTVPLHLAVFASVIRDQGNTPTDRYTTLQDLYGALWDKRIQHIQSSVDTKRVVEAIEALVSVMNERQQTAVPVGVMDSYGDVLPYLKSIDFIRQNSTTLQFFHQTFFDYCYARQFVAKNESLAQAVLQGPQGLFARSQIIQILIFLRGSDPVRGTRELKKLLTAPNLRFHLQHLILQWFGNIPNPSPDDVLMVRRILSNNTHLAIFLEFARHNREWLRVLDQENILRNLLQSADEQRIFRAISYLGNWIDINPTLVISYLRPYLGRSEEWDNRISYCLRHIRHWQDEEALLLLCALIERNKLPTLAFYNLAANPTLGCRALKVYLECRVRPLLQQAQRQEEPTEADPALFSQAGQYFFGEHGIRELVRAAATSVPHVLLENLLPWFIQIAPLLDHPVRIPESYNYGPIFDRWYGERDLGNGSVIAFSLAQALRHLAQSAPDQFRQQATILMRTDSLTLHRLLVYAYLGDPAAYIDDIVEYLLGDPRRLMIGEYFEASSYESMLLCAASFQYGNTTQRTQLEEVILSLYRPGERRRRASYGISQYQFLIAIPPERLSLQARRRQQELARKFPDYRLTPPQGFRTSAIGSPLLPQHFTHMNDTALFRAMKKYDESTAWGGRNERPLQGGATELGRVIQEQTQKNPGRFMRFLQTYGAQMQAHYISSILLGLAESDLGSDDFFHCLREWIGIITGHYRMGICMTLTRRADDRAPTEILEIVRDWAMTDPDPEDNEGGREPLQRGINTVRGVAIGAFCICSMAYRDDGIEATFQVLEAAASDPSSAVRACVIEQLGDILHIAPERTLRILEQTLDGHAILLSDRFTQNYLHRLSCSHFPQIRPWIEILLDNEDPPSCEAGARISCIAALCSTEAEDLATRCLTGPTPVRVGAAQVYAYNVVQDAYVARCLDRLRQLVHDADPEVRRAVGTCFEYLNIEHLETIRDFLEQFLTLPALIDGAGSLITFIKKVVQEDTALALRAVRAILDQLATTPVDPDRGYGFTEEDLVSIVLSVYLHTDITEEKTTAMDTFEHLLERGSWGAREALDNWDRR